MTSDQPPHCSVSRFESGARPSGLGRYKRGCPGQDKRSGFHGFWSRQTRVRMYWRQRSQARLTHVGVPRGMSWTQKSRSKGQMRRGSQPSTKVWHSGVNLNSNARSSRSGKGERLTSSMKGEEELDHNKKEATLNTKCSRQCKSCGRRTRRCCPCGSSLKKTPKYSSLYKWQSPSRGSHPKRQTTTGGRRLIPSTTRPLPSPDPAIPAVEAKSTTGKNLQSHVDSTQRLTRVDEDLQLHVDSNQISLGEDPAVQAVSPCSAEDDSGFQQQSRSKDDHYSAESMNHNASTCVVEDQVGDVSSVILGAASNTEKSGPIPKKLRKEDHERRKAQSLLKLLMNSQHKLVANNNNKLSRKAPKKSGNSVNNNSPQQTTRAACPKPNINDWPSLVKLDRPKGLIKEAAMEMVRNKQNGSLSGNAMKLLAGNACVEHGAVFKRQASGSTSKPGQQSEVMTLNTSQRSWAAVAAWSQTYGLLEEQRVPTLGSVQQTLQSPSMRVSTAGNTPKETTTNVFRDSICEAAELDTPLQYDHEASSSSVPEDPTSEPCKCILSSIDSIRVNHTKPYKNAEQKSRFLYKKRTQRMNQMILLAGCHDMAHTQRFSKQESVRDKKRSDYWKKKANICRQNGGWRIDDLHMPTIGDFIASEQQPVCKALCDESWGFEEVLQTFDGCSHTNAITNYPNTHAPSENCKSCNWLQNSPKDSDKVTQVQQKKISVRYRALLRNQADRLVSKAVNLTQCHHREAKETQSYQCVRKTDNHHLGRPGIQTESDGCIQSGTSQVQSKSPQFDSRDVKIGSEQFDSRPVKIGLEQFDSRSVKIGSEQFDSRSVKIGSEQFDSRPAKRHKSGSDNTKEVARPLDELWPTLTPVGTVTGSNHAERQVPVILSESSARSLAS